MPIKPENLKRYPNDWQEISNRIRFERAMGRCECEGECGHDHRLDWYGFERCAAIHDKPHPCTESIVVLTVAHLDHTPEHCDDDNLKAMCQRCHLAYDADHHRIQREKTARESKRTLELFTED